MIDIERKDIILRELENQSCVKVRDMIKILGVSESTVRRDFEELVQEEKAVFVYGGIKRKAESSILEAPRVGDMESAVIKDKLCRAAAAEVKDGMRIYVDGGTTFRTLMRYLKDKSVTVVTNNLLLALYYDAAEENRAELIELGGTYDAKYCLTTGPIAVEKIDQFQFDCALIAAESVDAAEGGVYIADIYLASVKQAAMKRASRVFLVTEEKKLHTRGLYRFAGLDEFSGVYIEKKENLPSFPIPVSEVE